MRKSPVPNERQCLQCEKVFPLTREYFHISPKTLHGFKKKCKWCCSVASKKTKLRQEMKEKGLKQCTGCKEWLPITEEYFHSDKRPNHPNKIPFTSKCKTCANALVKKDPWQSRNREQSREIKRRWEENHPDRVKDAAKKYRSKHKTTRQAGLRNYRAKKNNNGGTHTAQDIQLLYKQQKGKCYYCSKKVGERYDVDHVIPVSRGGRNDISNLVIACKPCNQSKGGRMPHEWAKGGKLL
jgi:5-methylcytosine-specific restriction endonuclease McrA